jgi:hypothetical protein
MGTCLNRSAYLEMLHTWPLSPWSPHSQVSIQLSVQTDFVVAIARHAEPNTPEDAFNYYHSNFRISIECAFGILVQRWGVLWRPMRVAYRKVSRVVELCMMMHNYCIDCNIRTMRRSTEKKWEDQGVCNINLNQQFLEGTGSVVFSVIPPEAMTKGRRRDLESSKRRELITACLRSVGLGLPAFSNYGKSTQITLHDYDDED